MDNPNDLTRGGILPKLLHFFFPVLLGMLFQQLYNTVDAVIVGNFVGPAALAAVGGSPAKIIDLVIGFFTGLSSGATVIISQYYGSHDEDKLAEAEHTIVTFCLIAGAALAVLGLLLAGAMIRLLQTPEDVFADALSYLRIYFAGTAAVLLFNVCSGILRAVGDSRTPLIALGICATLNIILDLVFVAVLSWGVAGAAWATVISLALSAVLLLRRLHLADDLPPLRLGSLRLYPKSLRRILYIGVPAGLQGSMYSISNIIIQTSVNGLGTAVAAAWTVTGKFDGIYWVTSNSFGMALCTFVGQCYGAGDIARMKKGARLWLLFDLGVSAVVSVVLLTLAPWGFRLFTQDAAVIDYSIEMVWCFVPYYVVWTFIEIITNILRGVGDSVRPMLIVTVGVCVLRILWIALVVPHWNTVVGISMSYPVTWALTAIALAVYYLTGSWMPKRRGTEN